MVIPFDVDVGRKLIRIAPTGSLTGRDLVETLEAVYAHPDWCPDLDTLWDGSKVRNVSIGKDDLPKLVAIQQKHRSVVGPGRDALVVQRMHHRVLAEMYILMLGNFPRVTRVFDTPEEAEAFLAGPLPPPAFLNQRHPAKARLRRASEVVDSGPGGHMVRPLVTVLLVNTLVLGAAGGPPPPAAVPAPTVTSAPAVGALWNASTVDLAKVGYSEREFLFSGTTAHGPYTSRMIVRRPLDARKFKGTVIVEWMNASAGFDMDVDFLSLVPLMTSEGYAYVGVSAQQVTVEFLRKRDAARYGSLAMTDVMPAQPAAFEVFAQAGMALRKNGTGTDPLGGLRAARLIAIGQSQSSGRLTTMVNAVHGLTLEPVYDAYLPHAGGGAPTRFPVPVFKLNSENEAPGYFLSRSVSDPKYRYWEVAGSAHQPVDGADYVLELLKAGRGAAFTCPFPVRGPGGPASADYALRAAVWHLDTWVRTGKTPPTAPLIEMTPNPVNPKAGAIQRDRFGNAIGGLRLPQQEAPTGRNSPAYACSSQTFPQWDVFDGNADKGKDPTDTYEEPASVKALYKDHDDYVRKFTAAARAAQRAGHLLKADADRLIKDVKTSSIWK